MGARAEVSGAPATPETSSSLLVLCVDRCLSESWPSFPESALASGPSLLSVNMDIMLALSPPGCQALGRGLCPSTEEAGTEALPWGPHPAPSPPRSLLAGAALHGAVGLPHGRLVDEHGVGGITGLQQVLLLVLVGCGNTEGCGRGASVTLVGVGIDSLGSVVTAPGGRCSVHWQMASHQDLGGGGEGAAECE